ncbi:MAG: phytanoyl-CoA dioxygenase family protein [Hyphomicrobiaceae bacterium]|nr:phytanoyl-CoA dioxygenase family protein [Hyphomicrobiaceae bacterium]
MKAARLVLWPWWLVQVFGQGKSFQDNPILGSKTLNTLGLHAARYALGHAMVSWRRLLLSPLASAEHRRQFRENGFVVVRDVLPPEDYARICDEARRAHGPGAPGELRECVQGDTVTRMMLLDGRTLQAMPATAAFVRDRSLAGLLMYIAGRRKRPLFLTHVVHNGVASGSVDPQKALHSDTFHSTMKGWYFLGDVRPQDGPFTYVPGSHRFSRRRMAWEREISIHACEHGNRYSAKGSLRLTEEDRLRLGYPEPVQLAVPGNTLVIADTHGFHRRGDAEGGAVRVAIYASSRSNPFNPLPGLLPSLAGWIESRGLAWSWRGADRRAAARGGLPSWRRVPAEALPEVERQVSSVLPGAGGRPQTQTWASPPCETKAA